MGDRICIMNDGKVVQIGAPLEVYRRPANMFVARFLGNPADEHRAGAGRAGERRRRGARRRRRVRARRSGGRSGGGRRPPRLPPRGHRARRAGWAPERRRAGGRAPRRRDDPRRDPRRRRRHRGAGAARSHARGRASASASPSSRRRSISSIRKPARRLPATHREGAIMAEPVPLTIRRDWPRPDAKTLAALQGRADRLGRRRHRARRRARPPHPPGLEGAAFRRLGAAGVDDGAGQPRALCGDQLRQARRRDADRDRRL